MPKFVISQCWLCVQCLLSHLLPHTKLLWKQTRLQTSLSILWSLWIESSRVMQHKMCVTLSDSLEWKGSISEWFIFSCGRKQKEKNTITGKSQNTIYLTKRSGEGISDQRELCRRVWEVSVWRTVNRQDPLNRVHTGDK